jgi:branched-chain amino acid transport system substrate-binding protein
MRRTRLGVIAALIVAATGTGAVMNRVTTQPLPASFCSPVFYSGSGSPRLLVVSDLPLLGLSSHGSVAMTRAIRFVLTQHRFRAGRYSVGYQSCDDSNPQTEQGDLSKCAANAKAYADNEAVVGIVGTWSSRCSSVELPIMNMTSHGPLVMVSPSNTNIGLTRAGPGTDPGEPGRYYPTGRRSFVRLVPPDNVQGAADAALAQQLRIRRIFLLDDKDSYGIGVAAAFLRAAGHLRLHVVGHASWNPDAAAFGDVTAAVRRARADGVLLAGYQCPHCGDLIHEVRGAVGQSGVIVVPDGFSLADLVTSVGGIANGLYGSSPGLRSPNLGALGRTIVRRFGAGAPGSGGPPYAAEAMEVLLSGIAASNGSRSSVTSDVLRERIHSDILGSFHFDKNGDIDPAGVSIYRVVAGRVVLNRGIRVPLRLLR